MFDNIGQNIANGLGAVFLGWIPQWFWDLLGWLPWIIGAIALVAVIGGLYRVYKVGGWPALTVAVGALGTAVGYVLGRRSTKPPNKPVNNSKLPEVVIKPKKHRKTLSDMNGNGINDRDERR